MIEQVNMYILIAASCDIGVHLHAEYLIVACGIYYSITNVVNVLYSISKSLNTPPRDECSRLC